LKASRDAQAEVSTTLASQVLGALHELLRGLHVADPARIEALAASRQDHLYDGMLTVLLRLVFLLYAEDRDLIPSRVDAAARAFYQQGYGARALHAKLDDDRAHYPDTMDERRGAWCWSPPSRGWGRALSERLVKAWSRWPDTRPKIPDDEDDNLHARRLVAQRCLYGVDKNPRAVDLAKLSL
jgi:hypothetical protein